MKIEIPFPVGSEVWLWWMSVGREPVKMKIETISIWMDKRYPGFKISYNFEHESGKHKYIPDELPVFATKAEAEAFREKCIVEYKKGMGCP